jgi:hypothetical protein
MQRPDNSPVRDEYVQKKSSVPGLPWRGCRSHTVVLHLTGTAEVCDRLPEHAHANSDRNEVRVALNLQRDRVQVVLHLHRDQVETRVRPRYTINQIKVCAEPRYTVNQSMCRTTVHNQSKYVPNHGTQSIKVCGPKPDGARPRVSTTLKNNVKYRRKARRPKARPR